MARSPSSPTRPRPAERERRRADATAWPIPEGCGQAYVDKVHEHDKATPATASRFGSAEPRICTPPLRPLTPETSLGFDVIDFALDVLGIVLLPWQRAALIRMLELNADGSLRFRTVVVLVARQNGKSTLAQILTIWLLCIWGWPLILGTAQDLDVAETLWEEVVDIVQADEELAGLVDGVVKVNGKKALNLTTGSKYKVKAANRRAGRGLSGNLVLLDELREHQTWDAWGAITKTTMARAEALILALSNAGDVTSRVLRYLRLMAHRALDDPDGMVATEDGGGSDGPTQFDLETLESFLDDADPDDELDEFDDETEGDLDLDAMEQDEDTLCLLEWSAKLGCDVRDRTGWSAANPSRNYTIMDRTIASAARQDPEWVFRTEVLCQWNDGATSGPFAPGQWQKTTVETVEDEPGKRRVAHPERDNIVGKVVAGIAQKPDGSITYIALAGYRPDGVPQVELVTGRYGPEWVGEWLASPDRKGRISAVGGQTRNSREATLLKKLTADRTFRMRVVPIEGSDLIDAYTDADDAIREDRVWHTPWPALDLAAATAEWKVLGGGTRVLDTANSPIDITALRAWIHAYWLLANHTSEQAPPPPESKPLESGDDDGGDDFDFDYDEDLTGDVSTMGF